MTENDKPEAKENDGKPKEKNGFQRFWEHSKKEILSIRFWIEVFALLGLGIYVYQTYRTNKLTQSALEISKQQFRDSQASSAKQFQIDQRPYVWWAVANADFWPDRVETTIALADFGKSPAIDVRTKGKVFLGKDAMDQAEVWFGQFRDDSRFATNDVDVTNPAIIPPGVLPSKTTGAASGYFVTRVGSDRTNLSSVLSAQSLDNGIVTAVRIEYFGSGGDFHYSEICLVRKLNGRVNQQGHPDGSITSCPKGNFIR